jgi:hypothetical protein
MRRSLARKTLLGSGAGSSVGHRVQMVAGLLFREVHDS